VLKGDHMDAVVRDATMIGAAAIRPMVTAHTIVRVSGAFAERLRARWMRIAIASAKQCRRAVVPDISIPVSVDTALSSIGLSQARELRIALAEPTTGASARAPATVSSTTPERAIMAVGPEGGWSQDELTSLSAAGFEPVTLGALTLRADAAALVAISAFRALWRE
jgi:16S rRNA (uracil1498-N3)-methyltransferase